MTKKIANRVETNFFGDLPVELVYSANTTFRYGAIYAKRWSRFRYTRNLEDRLTTQEAKG